MKTVRRRCLLLDVFDELTKLLGKEEPSSSVASLVPLQPRGSKPPFFLLHGEERLGRQIGVDRPVYELRPHGLDGQPAPSTIEKMAADYLAEIRTIQAEGPYFIGGYSFGGLVAFELAQQLTAQGQEVRLLVLLDPTIPINDRTESSAGGSSKAGLVRFGRKVWMHWKNLRRSGSKEKIEYLTKRIRWRLDLLKSARKMVACQGFLAFGRRVPERLRRFYFQEINRRATQNYTARFYTLPAALLRTQERKALSTYWIRLLVGQTDVYDMPGDHLDVIRGPHVQAWAERVRACLRSRETKLTDNPSTPSIARSASI